MSASLHITNSRTTEELQRILRDHAGPITPAESKVIGAGITRLTQRHLRARDNTHGHKYPAGGRRSHFWRKAAQSITFASDEEGITVSVTKQGVRLRYEGAPDGIRPVNAKALAIPAAGASYGRSPREFNDLHIVVFKNTNKAALVQDATSKGEPDKVLFWLVKKTKPIAPDRTVLPDPQDILAEAVHRLKTMREKKESTNV
jgi:hypothetical protein